MPSKVRITTTKKNAEMKKKRYFIRLRTSRLLSRVRRTLFPPASQPLCITISTEGLTQEQIDLLKELEAKGLIPKITWIESSPKSFEAKSLGCKILRGYDYAWIKIVLNKGQLPDLYSSQRYMTTPVFVKYIKSLGFTDIAGPSVSYSSPP